MAYALIFIPGSGIVASYQDPKTGELLPEFPQALAMFVWAWFIVSVIFTIAATRSSWVLLILLVFVDITFIFIGAGHMTGNASLGTAASATGFVSAFLACKLHEFLQLHHIDRYTTVLMHAMQTGPVQQGFLATVRRRSTSPSALSKREHRSCCAPYRKAHKGIFAFW